MGDTSKCVFPWGIFGPQGDTLAKNHDLINTETREHARCHISQPNCEASKCFRPWVIFDQVGGSCKKSRLNPLELERTCKGSPLISNLGDIKMFHPMGGLWNTGEDPFQNKLFVRINLRYNSRGPLKQQTYGTSKCVHPWVIFGSQQGYHLQKHYEFIQMNLREPSKGVLPQ